MPSSSLQPRSRSRICAWTVTSSAVVGSSAISSFGPQASAMAIITRWRMPPDSSCGYCAEPALGRADADLPQHLERPRAAPHGATGRDAAAAPRRSGRRPCSVGLRRSSAPGRSCAMRSPRMPRICALARAQQIDAVESDAAGGRCAPAARQEAHDRQRGHALAAAGFADEARRVSPARRRRRADVLDDADLSPFRR